MDRDLEPTNLDAVRRKLNRAGRRMTPQRAAVLQALTEIPHHPTAEEIHAVVQKRVPRISLGTVYRNLQVLVDEGYAARLPATEGSHRYDRLVKTHHHIVCRDCLRIEDVHLEPDAELCRLVEERSGFSVSSYRTEFKGRCQTCSGKRGA